MTADRPRADPVRSSPAPGSLDTGCASPARVYDYLLGGKDNLAVDRDAAERALRVVPQLRRVAEQNRAFLTRAVGHLAGPGGIGQFLDIGSGIPGPGNTVETVHARRPDAAVVFVDYEPVVITHTRALIGGSHAGRLAVVHADVRDPDTILNHPEVGRVLDFARPVAVVMGALLHFVGPQEDPLGILDAFWQVLAPGSALVLSHATGSGAPEADDAVVKGWDNATSYVTLRTLAQIKALFRGLELLEPGIVPPAQWRPDTPAPPEPEPVWALAGVAVLSARPTPAADSRRTDPAQTSA